MLTTNHSCTLHLSLDLKVRARTSNKFFIMYYAIHLHTDKMQSHHKWFLWRTPQRHGANHLIGTMNILPPRKQWDLMKQCFLMTWYAPGTFIIRWLLPLTQFFLDYEIFEGLRYTRTKTQKVTIRYPPFPGKRKLNSCGWWHVPHGNGKTKMISIFFWNASMTIERV